MKNDETPGAVAFVEMAADRNPSTPTPGASNMRIQVFGRGPGGTDEWRYNSGNHFTSRCTPTLADARYLIARDVSDGDTRILFVMATTALR